MAEDLGKRIVANMIMLGFFTAATRLASRESMQQALETSVKPKTVSLNLQAFSLGYEYREEKEQVA
jgi:2-oxoglutarate ferredoxin oxidoreductase subunit gamma